MKRSIRAWYACLPLRRSLQSTSRRASLQSSARPSALSSALARSRHYALLSAWTVLVAMQVSTASAETTLPMPSAFQTCAGCHSVKPAQNFDAPSLAGVYGRHAGTEPGYTYSTAMKNSKVIWDAATLDAYLTAPQKVVPNNQMAFAGLPDPRARAEIIRYLRSLSSN